jgi:hypothetical protein
MYVDTDGAYIWASDGANLKTWTFGLNGNLRLPTNGMITYANGQSILSGITGAANTGNLLFNGTTIYFDASKASAPDTVLNISPNVEGWAYLQLPNDVTANVANVRLHNDAGNIEIAAGDFSNFGPLYNWYFKNDGSLELPQVTAITTQAVIRSGGDIVINANDTGQWKFGTDGNLSLPNGSKLWPTSNNIDLVAGENGWAELQSFDANRYVWVDNNGAYVGTSWLNGAKQWTFNAQGNLTLPNNGTIGEIPNPSGFPGHSILLQPSGYINPNQRLLVYPTGGYDFNHLHLTSGDLYDTELFLGNDNLYVKLANTGNVEIRADDNAGNTAQWAFRVDGTTLFPNQVVDGGTAPIELKSRSWSQLTYNNVDMTPAPNKNHSTTFYVEGGDALLEIFVNGHLVMTVVFLYQMMWVLLNMPTVLIY